MGKVYLSGAISGVEDLNRPKFEKYRRWYEKMGHEVVCPLDLVDQDNVPTWSECMKTDLKIMLECDFVVALDDWMHSPGANAELLTAYLVGIPIRDYDGNNISYDVMCEILSNSSYHMTLMILRANERTV